MVVRWFYGSVNIGFFLQGALGGDYTRRYWKLDRQGGCENMLEGLIGVMTRVER